MSDRLKSKFDQIIRLHQEARLTHAQVAFGSADLATYTTRQARFAEALLSLSDDELVAFHAYRQGTSSS